MVVVVVVVLSSSSPSSSLSPSHETSCRNSRAKTRSFHRSAQNCEDPSPTERAVRSILLLLPKCINHNFSFFFKGKFLSIPSSAYFDMTQLSSSGLETPCRSKPN